MFAIYDENFNIISLPQDDLKYGLVGLDFFISSTSQYVSEHTIDGMSGSVITGYRDTDRTATLSVMLKSKDTIDYRLKRDRVYAFFKRLGNFFVTEKYQGNKLLKVRVIDSYQFERLSRVIASADIPLKIIGQPYWVSRFKSMDLHGKSGIDFNGHWSFGMGLDVDPNKLKYQFSNQSSFDVYNAGTVPLKAIQEKDNCVITININQSVTNFKLYDATGGYFEYNPTHDDSWVISSGAKIVLNGHYITLNNTPIIERTNRYFMLLLAGNNHFNVEGLSNYTITFDFRFKYD